MATAIKDGDGKQCFVPCGKCSPCLNRRAAEWSFRLLQEEKVSTTAYFVTMTYSTDHVPISRNGYLELKKKDLQDYFKRLRRSHEYYGKEKKPIKYFAVGEYGGKIKRPHYHVILFNADLETMFSKKDLMILQMSNFDGEQRVCSKHWTAGHVTVGTVSGASVGYVMKYISEPVKNFRINDDRVRPFSVMSKGLGIGYCNQRAFNWHHADMKNRMYVNVGDGKKMSMPRFYKDRFYNKKERKEISDHVRIKLVDDLLDDILKHYHADEQAEAYHNKKQAQKFDQEKNFNNIKKLRKCKKSNKLILLTSQRKMAALST